MICRSEEEFSDVTENYYIKVDNNIIECENEFLNAFDKFFKIHYILNLKFDNRLSKMFNFFEVFVYKIKNVKPVGVVHEMYKKLTSVSV